MANLEIQPGAGLSATVTDGCDNVARRNPVAGGLQRGFIVSVQRHVSFAVIDDNEQPHSDQPVRKDHAAMIDRTNFAASRSLLIALRSKIEQEGSEIARLGAQEQDLARLIAELTSILSDSPGAVVGAFSWHR